MAWISSVWERIAAGETHSGSVISQKEEKVARNVNISSFYMYHSPAKERWFMFKTGASTEVGWDTKTTRGTQSEELYSQSGELYSQSGELYSQLLQEQRVPEPLIVWLFLFCSGIQPPYSGGFAILREEGVERYNLASTSAKQEALQRTAIGNVKHSAVPKLPIFP